MKTNKEQTQQGDILAIKLNKMPDGQRTTIARGRCVIGHGESGHSHVIEAEEDDAELIRIGEKMLLNLKKSSQLVHEEHHTQTWEPGIYEIGQVIEKDWLNDMVRPVID